MEDLRRPHERPGKAESPAFPRRAGSARPEEPGYNALRAQPPRRGRRRDRREELDTLAPAAAELRASGMKITAPLPTDAAWAAHLAGRSAGPAGALPRPGAGPAQDGPRRRPRGALDWGLSIRGPRRRSTAFDIAWKNKSRRLRHAGGDGTSRPDWQGKKANDNRTDRVPGAALVAFSLLTSATCCACGC